MTADSPIQLRASRTDHVSATNHKICQFVTIRGSGGGAYCNMAIIENKCINPNMHAVRFNTLKQLRLLTSTYK